MAAAWDQKLTFPSLTRSPFIPLKKTPAQAVPTGLPSELGWHIDQQLRLQREAWKAEFQEMRTKYRNKVSKLKSENSLMRSEIADLKKQIKALQAKDTLKLPKLQSREVSIKQADSDTEDIEEVNFHKDVLQKSMLNPSREASAKTGYRIFAPEQFDLVSKN